MRRRFFDKNRELEDFLIRFYPAGNYTWVVPGGCTEVDVFLVGGGGGSGNGSGAGSGYTKTYKRNNIGIKQGSQISVTPGQEINIIVGKGGAGLYYGYPEKGGFSQFMNSSYRAEGGNPSGNGLLNGENSTGGPYTGGNLYPFLRKSICCKNSREQTIFVKILRYSNKFGILTSILFIKEIEERFKVSINHHQHLLSNWCW